MVNIRVLVRHETDFFGVVVLAENIRQALRLVRRGYPTGKVLVKFPIDPKSFFVEDPSAQAGLVGFDSLKVRAA